MSWFVSNSIGIPQISAANALLAPETTPRVMVFLGATSGIGRAALENLVSHGTPIKAYVIGRDSTRCRPWLGKLEDNNSNANLVFLEGQASLLRDMCRLCWIIASQEEVVDAVFCSAGYLPLNGREDTSEGLDTSLVLSFYARMMLIVKLLPQLKRAVHPRVVNILAAGQENPDVDVVDLDFDSPGRFATRAAASAFTTYLTLCLCRLAKANPDIIFVHAHPGSVATGAWSTSRKKMSGPWRWALQFVFEPVVGLLSMPASHAGQRSVFVLTNSRYGGWGTGLPEGAMRARNVDGGVGAGALFLESMWMTSLDQKEMLEKLRARGAGEIVWNHMAGVFESVDSE